MRVNIKVYFIDSILVTKMSKTQFEKLSKKELISEIKLIREKKKTKGNASSKCFSMLTKITLIDVNSNNSKNNDYANNKAIF